MYSCVLENARLVELYPDTMMCLSVIMQPSDRDEDLYTPGHSKSGLGNIGVQHHTHRTEHLDIV